jgi:hypothetical protein
VSLDFDSGVSAVNVTNRLLLFLDMSGLRSVAGDILARRSAERRKKPSP